MSEMHFTAAEQQHRSGPWMRRSELLLALLAALVLLPTLLNPQWGLLDDGAALTIGKGLFAPDRGQSLIRMLSGLGGQSGRFVPLYWLSFGLQYLLFGNHDSSITIPFVAASRTSGTSKFSVRRMLRLAADGVTGFSTVPLKLVSYLGYGLAAVSGIYLLYALARGLFFRDQVMAGWTSMMFVVLLLGGAQLIGLGVVGEYIGRIYDEVRNRPLYLVRQQVGLDHREHKAVVASSVGASIR